MTSDITVDLPRENHTESTNTNMNKEQGFLAGAGIVASNHAERTGGRFHLQVALGVDPMEALEHPHLWSSSQLHFFIPSHGGAAHVTPPAPPPPPPAPPPAPTASGAMGAG